MPALMPAFVRLNLSSGCFTPPATIDRPRMSSRLPRMLPVIDAFTRSTRPAWSATIAMMSSAALPNVALRSRPAWGRTRRDLLRRLTHEAGERQHAETRGDEHEDRRGVHVVEHDRRRHGQQQHPPEPGDLRLRLRARASRPTADAARAPAPPPPVARASPGVPAAPAVPGAASPAAPGESAAPVSRARSFPASRPPCFSCRLLSCRSCPSGRSCRAGRRGRRWRRHRRGAIPARAATSAITISAGIPLSLRNRVSAPRRSVSAAKQHLRLERPLAGGARLEQAPRMRGQRHPFRLGRVTPHPHALLPVLQD